MGKFNCITIDLDCCEIAGVKDEMELKEKLERASKYYEARFKEIEESVKYINEQFLMWLVNNLCYIEYPFWEWGISNGDTKYPEYIIEEEMKKFEDENGEYKHDSYSASPIYKEIRDYNAYKNKDNLNSYKIVEKYLKVLNFQKLITTIEPNSISTYEEVINFQLSSEICSGNLLCATYGEIDGDNRLTVTHNC